MDLTSRNYSITVYDTSKNIQAISYDEIMLRMGNERELSLREALLLEQQKIGELNANSKIYSPLIHTLGGIHKMFGYDPRQSFSDKQARSTIMIASAKNNLPKRIKMLHEYYTANHKHSQLLDRLVTYLMANSENDHSPHDLSLIRYSLDYLIGALKHLTRKNDAPGALHSIESARGIAKNGVDAITIVGTLLHDVIEERLDEWTHAMIETELRDPIYGDHAGKKAKEIPGSLRHQIILKHMEEYNTRASAIYYSIGMHLYSHIKKFQFPEKYYKSVNSIMSILAKLSRTRDISYYKYIQQFIFPAKSAALHVISKKALLEILREDFPQPEPLFDEFLTHIDNVYQTHYGEFISKEEIQRNAFREILCKIGDRLNNTRDMPRGPLFDIANRLYGAGYKNIYMVQAIEEKIRKNKSFIADERRVLETKFLDKPKIAALYQMLSDIDYLENEVVGSERIRFLDAELEKYKTSKKYRMVTNEGRQCFDGTIALFNRVILGDKKILKETAKNPNLLAQYAVTFRSLLESYIVYPALIEQEMRLKKTRHLDKISYEPFKIAGLTLRMENLSQEFKKRSGELSIKTFRRRIVS
jgi:hypothetical protein